MAELPQIGPPSSFNLPATPSVPRETPAWEGANRAIGEVGGAVNAYIAGIERNQILADTAEATSAFERAHIEQLEGTFADAKQMSAYAAMPPKDALQKFFTDQGQAGRDLMSQTLKKYSTNPATGYELAPRLQDSMNYGLKQGGYRLLQELHTNARLRITGPTMLAKVAQLATMDPADPGRIKGVQAFDDLIDNTSGILDAEREEAHLRFHNQLATETLQQRALDDPASVMLGKPPPDVTPEQFETIQRHALENYQLQHSMVDAELNRTQARNDADALKYLSNGQAPPFDMEALRRQGLISERVFELWSGHPYVPDYPDAPGEKAKWQGIIADMKPEEAPIWEAAINDAHKEGRLSNRSAADLMFSARMTGLTGKDEFKAAKAQYKDRLRQDYFKPLTDRFNLEFDPKLSPEAFNSKWDALTSTAKTKADLDAANDKMIEWLHSIKAINYRDGGGKGAALRTLGRGGYPVTPPAPPPGRPGAPLPAGAAATDMETPEGIDATLDFIRRKEGFTGKPSPKGAIGFYQIMPKTAEEFFLDKNRLATDEDYARSAARVVYTTYLRQFHGNKRLALAAYNAGPGAVLKYGGVPPYPETTDYVRSGMGELR